MKILYVSHYFPPEMGAPAGRVAGLAREWARAGHEVHVLTGFPHHPTGIIPAEYRRAFRRGFLRERVDGYDVHRTWIFPAANRGKFRRSLNYASFMTSATLSGALGMARPDIVVATSPQLLCAVAGHFLAKRFGTPLVMEVRDLWPESLVAVGASRHSSPLVTLLERLACQMYRRASHVVTITEAQRAAIVAEGVSGEQVSVIPNGVDAAFFDEAPARPANGKFVVTYIGTLGMAHRLETLLEAAHLLRNEEGVEFRIVGEGARRQALEARAQELKLTNVMFAGERPRGEVPRWLAESDACAVLLRRTDVFRTVVPSKMLEIMAAGRPIILGVEGEALALLERAQAGIGVAPESAEQIVAAIRRLRKDAALGTKLGENGRAFVRQEFRREALAEKYLALLEQVKSEAANGKKSRSPKANISIQEQRAEVVKPEAND